MGSRRWRFGVGSSSFSSRRLSTRTKKKRKRRHVESHGPDGELLLPKEVGVVAPERGRAELIEATAAMVALTGAERV